MNGNVEQFVFDTNVIIRFLDGKIDGLPAGKRFVSVITEMELLAFAGLTAKDEYNIRPQALSVPPAPEARCSPALPGNPASPSVPSPE
jgi:predicted nucleic acid-binding protein